MSGFDFSSYILAFRSYIYIHIFSTAFAFYMERWVNRNYMSKIHGLQIQRSSALPDHNMELLYTSTKPT